MVSFDLKLDSVISEALSKKDLFDFYAIVHAVNDRFQYYNKEKRVDISRAYHDIVDRVYNDTIRQLGIICVNKIAHYNEDVDARVELFGKYGFERPADFTDYFAIDKVYDIIPSLSINEMVSIVSKVLNSDNFNIISGVNRWFDILKLFLKSANLKKSSDKVLAIDRIHSSIHNDGSVVDYFDEYKWIHQFLHFRSVANQRQILANASDYVRDLIGYNIDDSGSRTNLLSLLRVAIVRGMSIKNYDSDFVTFSLSDNVLQVTFEMVKFINGNTPLYFFKGDKSTIDTYEKYFNDSPIEFDFILDIKVSGDTFVIKHGAFVRKIKVSYGFGGIVKQIFKLVLDYLRNQ